jgi:F0F1-type ATP synthase assembly protein I
MADDIQWQRIMRYAFTGAEFTVIFVATLMGGLWLDRKLGTLPAFTLVGGLLGFAMGLYRLIQEARRAQREEEQQHKDGHDKLP